MNTETEYDIAFLGNYTKDTIVSSSGKRIVDGGAFNYGSHVAVRMGLKTAAITRLATEDFHVVRELEQLGVAVFAQPAPKSTCLRLEYPTSDVDDRIPGVHPVLGRLGVAVETGHLGVRGLMHAERQDEKHIRQNHDYWMTQE